MPDSTVVVGIDISKTHFDAFMAPAFMAPAFMAPAFMAPAGMAARF